MQVKFGDDGVVDRSVFDEKKYVRNLRDISGCYVLVGLFIF